VEACRLLVCICFSYMWRPKYFAVLIVAVVVSASLEPSPTELPSPPEGAAGVELGQLFLRNTNASKSARIYIGGGSTVYSLGVNDAGLFTLGVSLNGSSSERDLMVVADDRASFSNVLARTVHTDQLIIGNIPQWQVVREDTFSEMSPAFLDLEAAGADPYNGWKIDPAKNQITQCAGLYILTIDDSKSGVEKTYSKLPRHTQLRITATAHFIDDWQEETAFMRLNDQYAWTESHGLRNGALSISVCGSQLFPETKFSVPIDISIPHTADSVKISFGTTTEKGSQARFGLSSVSVHTRFDPPKPKSKPVAASGTKSP